VGFLYAFWRRRHASPNPTKSRTEQRQGGRLGYTRPRYLDQGFVSCNGLTWSNRRRTDLYVRWWGRGGAARCPLSRSRTLDGQATPESSRTPQPCDGSGRQWGGSGKNTTAGQNRQCFYYSRHRTTAGWISGSVPAVQKPPLPGVIAPPTRRPVACRRTGSGARDCPSGLCAGASPAHRF